MGSRRVLFTTNECVSTCPTPQECTIDYEYLQKIYLIRSTFFLIAIEIFFKKRGAEETQYWLFRLPCGDEVI